MALTVSEDSDAFSTALPARSISPPAAPETFSMARPAAPVAFSLASSAAPVAVSFMESTVFLPGRSRLVQEKISTA